MHVQKCIVQVMLQFLPSNETNCSFNIGSITSYTSHFQIFLIALFAYPLCFQCRLSFQILNLDRFHILIAFQQESVFWCENHHLKTIKAFSLLFMLNLNVFFLLQISSPGYKLASRLLKRRGPFASKLNTSESEGRKCLIRIIHIYFIFTFYIFLIFAFGGTFSHQLLLLVMRFLV